MSKRKSPKSKPNPVNFKAIGGILITLFIPIFIAVWYLTGGALPSNVTVSSSVGLIDRFQVVSAVNQWIGMYGCERNIDIQPFMPNIEMVPLGNDSSRLIYSLDSSSPGLIRIAPNPIHYNENGFNVDIPIDVFYGTLHGMTHACAGQERVFGDDEVFYMPDGALVVGVNGFAVNVEFNGERLKILPIEEGVGDYLAQQISPPPTGEGIDLSDKYVQFHCFITELWHGTPGELRDLMWQSDLYGFVARMIGRSSANQQDFVNLISVMSQLNSSSTQPRTMDCHDAVNYIHELYPPPH